MKLIPTVPKGVAVFVTRNGRIAASMRTDNCATFKRCWQVPGGTVEPNETPLAAAQRELFEETGIDCRQWNLRPLGNDLRFLPTFYRGYAYQLELHDGHQLSNFEPEKASPWIWLTPEQFRFLRCVSGLKKYLPKLRVLA